MAAMGSLVVGLTSPQVHDIGIFYEIFGYFRGLK